jgi:lipopolysaccharide biosynthesis protein
MHEVKSAAELKARLIAFFLPQFHPIPENDAWWGKGFTEWTNVTKAKPLFRGHDQPQYPADLGYYDLRLPEVRTQQAELARAYGIEGFCYWHYWFNGKQLLERPVNEVIASGKPDFPFCLGWANHLWSREWDGSPNRILQEQTYGGEEDDRKHFEYLLPALHDRRAIRVDGKPIFLIYKAKMLPDPSRTTNLWRQIAIKEGLAGLYLMSVETIDTFGWDPKLGGFDAAVMFQPNWEHLSQLKKIESWSVKLFKKLRYGWHLRVIDYELLWRRSLSEVAHYPRYPGVFPRWDNTPRRGKRGLVVLGSTPHEYGKWLKSAVATLKDRPQQHRIVFINAWNEWAEGNYLEPDSKFGLAYLEATYDAICAGSFRDGSTMSRGRHGA